MMLGHHARARPESTTWFVIPCATRKVPNRPSRRGGRLSAHCSITGTTIASKALIVPIAIPIPRVRHEDCSPRGLFVSGRRPVEVAIPGGKTRNPPRDLLAEHLVLSAKA